MVGAQVHQHQEGVLPFAHVRISLNLLHLLLEFIESSVRGVVSVAVVFIFIVVVIVVVIVGSRDGDVAVEFSLVIIGVAVVGVVVTIVGVVVTIVSVVVGVGGSDDDDVAVKFSLRNKPHLLTNRLRLFSDIILPVLAESAVRGSLIFPVKLFTMGLIRFQYLFQQTWELDSIRLDYLGIRGFVQVELLAE